MAGEEPAALPHHMGRFHKREQDISNQLASDSSAVYDAYRDLHNEGAGRLHKHQSSLIRSALTGALDENLGDYEAHLRKKYGDKYEDHHLTALYHLEKGEGMEWGRKIAKSAALKMVEVSGGSKVREFYEKEENAELLDKFVEGELNGIASQLGMQITSVDDLARLLWKEKNALRSVLDGSDPETLQQSSLAQVLANYVDNATAVKTNRKRYTSAISKHFQDDGDAYDLFIKERLNPELERAGASATPVLEKGQALALYRQSGRDTGIVLDKSEGSPPPGLKYN